jgi:sialic acid synthase SpsE
MVLGLQIKKYIMVKFISEVSSNHDRDIDRSLDFISASAKAGCDAVKFQLFKIEKLFAPEILAKSEKHRRRKEWELPLEFLPLLAEKCKLEKIQFSCTPFYLEAVKELEPYVDFYKIASYELLWDDLLIACAKTMKPIIMSTGMATIDEIKHAVMILKANGCTSLSLLHCTSAYPTPHFDANLSAIETIRNLTNCDVGWSDHTVNSSVINRAINRWGATIIEFHLDLDGKGDEYATGHCWLPNQIANVISDIKLGFESDGNGIKEPVASELPDRFWRADPSDGLRPLKFIRNTWQG